MSRADAVAVAYLAAIVAFILALRFLSSPRTAPLGNRIGALGMAVAIAATFAQAGIHNYWSILVVMALSAPIRLPSGAVLGEERKRRARIKATIAAR